MAKGIKSLTGVDKDAYLERVHAAAKDAGEPVDEPMLARLKTEVTRVWVKAGALADAAEAVPEPAPALPVDDTFNPYEPNVIVVLRTAGRDRLLDALRSIETADRLRLLAREQQLGVDVEVVDAEELRLAIVTAAERRVANRRAAAS